MTITIEQWLDWNHRCSCGLCCRRTYPTSDRRITKVEWEDADWKLNFFRSEEFISVRDGEFSSHPTFESALVALYGEDDEDDE